MADVAYSSTSANARPQTLCTGAWEKSSRWTPTTPTTSKVLLGNTGTVSHDIERRILMLGVTQFGS
jgi:hypothetical protein